MIMLMTNTCVLIILLVCLYMSMLTVMIILVDSKNPHTRRIRRLVSWMYFVSYFVLLIVCWIMSSTYCT